MIDIIFFDRVWVEKLIYCFKKKKFYLGYLCSSKRVKLIRYYNFVVVYEFWNFIVYVIFR